MLTLCCWQFDLVTSIPGKILAPPEDADAKFRDILPVECIPLWGGRSSHEDDERQAEDAKTRRAAFQLPAWDRSHLCTSLGQVDSVG